MLPSVRVAAPVSPTQPFEPSGETQGRGVPSVSLRGPARLMKGPSMGPGLALLTILMGCGTSGEGDSKVLVQGGLGAEIPAVVQIEASRGNALSFCTGVFVARNALLTADHCLRGRDMVSYYTPAGDEKVGRTIFLHDAPKDCAKALNPDKCVNEELLDMALVVFGENVAPATLPLLSTPAAPGAAAQLVGYGATECDSSAERVLFTGRKAAKLEKNLDTIPSGSTARLTSSVTFVKGARSVMCRGDSGGPWIDKATGAVFAVMSSNLTYVDGRSRAVASNVQALLAGLRLVEARERLAFRWVEGVSPTIPNPGLPLPPRPGNPAQPGNPLVLAKVATKDPMATGNSFLGALEVMLPQGARPGSLSAQQSLRALGRERTRADKARLLVKDGVRFIPVSEAFLRVGTNEAALPLTGVAVGRRTFKVEALKGGQVLGAGEFTLDVVR